MSRAATMSSSAGTVISSGPKRLPTEPAKDQELTSDGLRAYSQNTADLVYRLRQESNNAVNALSPAILGNDRTSFNDAKNEILALLDHAEKNIIPCGRAFADKGSKMANGEPASGINIEVVNHKTGESGIGNISQVIDGLTGGQVTKKFGRILRYVASEARKMVK